MARGYLLVLVYLLSVPAVWAEPLEWDRFRGANGAGVSHATTIPVTWTESDYNWTILLPGTGHSSPVVFNKHVYVTCADPDTAERRVLCVDASAGHVVWRRDFPSQKVAQHHDNGYATATPAVDRHGLVVTWATSAEVVLLALAHDGAEMWRRDLGPFVGPHGTGVSPIVVDDRVVLANEQEDYKALARAMGRENPEGPAGASFLIAVDRVTGETCWQVPRASTLAPYATPCVRRLASGAAEIIFSSTSHGVTAIDAVSGTVNWELPDLFSDRCVGSPICAAGLVFASYGHGTTGQLCVAVRPGDAETHAPASVAYEITRTVPLVPTPVVAGDRLYLWADGGVVSCLDVANGTLIWRERVAGNFYGSPVWVDGRVYCIAKNGDVVVLAASDQFQQLARVPLGEASFSTPAVADGVMYLRTASRLFSLGGPRR